MKKFIYRASLACITSIVYLAAGWFAQPGAAGRVQAEPNSAAFTLPQWPTPLLASADPAWQQTATGLLGVSAGRQTTAGQSFTIWQQDWPGLTMKGGVRANAWFMFNNAIIGPAPVGLGKIKVPGASGAFSGERADWAHNEMTFTYTSNGTKSLRIWASRLSPAVLVQSQSNALQFLGGPMPRYTFAANGGIVKQPDGLAFPKYAAFQSGGTTQVAALGTTNTALNLSSNWMVLWYADNSFFMDSKKPLSHGGMPSSNAYAADVPILLVFQNLPTAIKHASDGGVELTFGSAGTAGYVAVLPLFGRNFQRTSQTTGWASGLPADVSQRAQWWASRLCSYPVSASETYAYDDAADVATITENISTLPICSGGTAFAPLPPMLSVAKDALGITFSGTVVDGNLPTEFGPSLGIENTQTYSWRVPNLKRYADTRRELGTGAVPPDIGVDQDLNEQVNKVVATGHLRPWTFMDGLPRHAGRGDLYWANPADTVYQLTQVAKALPAGATKQSLVTYIQNERTHYPPEDQFDLPLLDGVTRPNFSSYPDAWDYAWTEERGDVHQKRVPLWNFYALSEYYDLTGETPPASVLQKAGQVLDKDMREQDWATSYWFDGFQDRSVAVVNANRHFAGLIGYVRLATRGGDISARSLGMALLAKAAMLRVGMAKYLHYYYGAGLVELPAEHDWMVKNTAGTWNGYLFNADWASVNDDARQITVLNQYGAYLYDQSATKGEDANECCFFWPYLITFRDMVPETARLLVDHAKTDAQVYERKVKALFPHWYAAFAEGTLASEHNMNHPVDSYQIFLAEAWISGATANDLLVHADIPWLEMGDLFYMHKLAEVIAAYRGGNWGDSTLQAEVSASAANALIKQGDKITLSVRLSSDLGPITTTVRVTTAVPVGLSYVPGSLKTEPANMGTLNANQAPTLSWQGSLNAAVTISFNAQVTEQTAHSIDVSFMVEDKPGRTQTYHLQLALNQRRFCLPLVIRD